MPESSVRRKRRTTNKLLKAATARTVKGRLNYVVDMIFDENLKNPYAEEAAHFLVEMGLGRGSTKTKLLRWARKFGRYRLGGH